MKSKRILSLILALFLLTSSFAILPGCNKSVDYAASVSLDLNSSETVKAEVTVKSHIDGDTTHFYVPDGITETGVLKARYLGINTPESTGQIQAWGKAAAKFTREKLENATSIYIESDNDKWNLDSTGARYTVWVWYKGAEDTDYRNLNIEIMQNGLAIQSNSANNRYGEQVVAAYNQAKAEGLHIHGTEKDPNFFYGDTKIEISLPLLRANIADYVGVRVAFEAVVVKNSGQDGVYVEAYDAETDMYNGMYIYYGASASTGVREILKIGNRILVVGKISEFNGTYQISDVSAGGIRVGPIDLQRLDTEIHEASYTLTDIDTFRNGKVSVIVNEDEAPVEFDYAYMALGSSIAFNSLTVVDAYTTSNPASSSKGAMSLYCEDENGNKITIRTNVLYENDVLVTQDRYLGKTINVKGVVDYYNPNSSDDDMGDNGDNFYYQIKVTTVSDIEVLN